MKTQLKKLNKVTRITKIAREQHNCVIQYQGLFRGLVGFSVRLNSLSLVAPLSRLIKKNPEYILKKKKNLFLVQAHRFWNTSSFNINCIRYSNTAEINMYENKTSVLIVSLKTWSLYPCFFSNSSDLEVSGFRTPDCLEVSSPWSQALLYDLLSWVYSSLCVILAVLGPCRETSLVCITFGFASALPAVQDVREAR